MKLIADTSIWSDFLRRKSPQKNQHIELLRNAIAENKVQMLGIIKQELLSGIKQPEHFGKLAGILQGFPDLLASSEDHLLAAKFFNLCRKKGVQGSPVDFLICAQAYHQKMKILASDQDFRHYAKHIPIDLHEV